MSEVTARPETLTDAQLVTLGITRIPAESFAVGGYRYSNAREAIAAADRIARTANDA